VVFTVGSKAFQMPVAKGFEFFWRDKKTIKNVDYWIFYSYLDTKRDFLNFPYATMTDFAATHTASLLMKKFVQPWKMSLVFWSFFKINKEFKNDRIPMH
jgi:hypothetical protein